MKHRYPLPLYHSWPLFERARHFELGWVDRDSVRPPHPADVAAHGEELAREGVGLWHCDLSDNSLTWSPAVYDIFGLPRGSAVARKAAVALYGEASRAAMERLRAHAIAHRRGFTLDVEIAPAAGRSRWVRLIAAPLCEGERVIALHGLKWQLPPGDR